MKIDSQRALYKVLCVFVILFAFSGCEGVATDQEITGGGDGGVGSVNPSPAPVQGDQLAGPAQITASYSDQEIDNVVRLVGNITKQLVLAQGLTKKQIAQAYLNAVMAGVPQVADGGLNSSENGAWIRLKDGTPIGISTDVRESTTPSDPDPTLNPWNPPTSGSLWNPDQLRKYATNGFNAFIPNAYAADPKAYVFPGTDRAMLMEVSNLAPNAARQIGSMLTDKNYKVSGMTEPTMGALRTSFTGQYGVLWLSTHGSYAVDKQGYEFFAIASGEPADGTCQATSQQCDQNRKDLREDRAVRIVLAASGKNHLMLYAKWVKDYWKFAANALVFLDACESMKDKNAVKEFVNALHFAGAGTVLGWTESVEKGFAERASTFFFDRILGANKFTPLTPKQRPFSAKEVYDSMVLKNRVLDPAWNAKLVLQQFTVQESILLPSIQNMVVDEAAQTLNLYGEFGANQGAVTIGGAQVSSAWSQTNVIVNLPLTGTSSKGVVQAIAASSLKSNDVPLTEWNGKFKGRHTFIGMFGAPGPYWDFDCSLFRLRADVHKFRLKPEQPATAGYYDETHGFALGAPIDNVARNSTCSYTSDGVGVTSDGSSTVQYSFVGVNGPVKWGDNQQLPATDWFVGVGELFPSTHEINLFVNSQAPTQVELSIEILRPQPAPPKITSPHGYPSIGAVGRKLKEKKYQFNSTTWSMPQTVEPFMLDFGDTGTVDMTFDATPGSIPTADTAG